MGGYTVALAFVTEASPLRIHRIPMNSMKPMLADLPMPLRHRQLAGEQRRFGLDDVSSNWSGVKPLTAFAAASEVRGRPRQGVVPGRHPKGVRCALGLSVIALP